MLEKVENYHIIVKEPMDFGTMRAKVHEGMYTSLEQFKVYKIKYHMSYEYYGCSFSLSFSYTKVSAIIHELVT
jgi:bromodomain-containing protein 7/9